MNGPKIMIYCVAIAVLTGFIFLVILLFVSGGGKTIGEIIESHASPLSQILLAATGSPVVSVCLALFPMMSLVLVVSSSVSIIANFPPVSRNHGHLYHEQPNGLCFRKRRWTSME